MRYRDLKVGMYITGKPNNGYPITNQYSICKILRIDGLGENIRVEVVQSKENRVVGTRWDVDYKLFVKSDIALPNANVPTPFPVGSYVIGNNKNCYGQTRRGCVCRVTNYKYDYYDKRIGFDSQYMKVAIVKKDGTLGGAFYVRPSWFDACDFKPYDGLFGTAYHRKLFTVSDDLIKVEGVNKDSPCYNQLIKECVANGLVKKG